MTRARWLACGLVLVCWAPGAPAGSIPQPFKLDKVNSKLCGHILDFTNNHVKDHRIWCPSICQKRDLYVYLPPGYDPCQRYPLVLWFHGLMQDENSFVDRVACLFDEAIVSGKFPPVIIACPDGSIEGNACRRSAGCFFINSKAGCFEDYIIHDVWDFLFANFPLRPEREAHVLAGVSMGGFGAYNLGIKYRDRFKVVVGIFPPLNLRWMDCCGNYRADFDPCNWCWREHVNPKEVIAKLFHGLIPVHLKVLTDRLVGRGPDAVGLLSKENPIELLDRLCLKPGELDMYIGYGGMDDYNCDAQVESFLHVARERGLCIAVECIPDGRHNTDTGKRLFPGVIEWAAPLIAPYAPPPPCPAHP